MTEFHPETQSYTIDGQPVSRVSNILKEAGIIDDTHYTTEGANRGTEAHEAIRMISTGVLPAAVYAHDSRIQAYLSAVRDLGIVIDRARVEVPIGSEEYRVAGTPDAYGTMTLYGKEDVGIDWKTGGPQPWWGVQFGLYRLIDGVKHRVAIELRADGQYRLHVGYKNEPFDSRYWDQVALSCLTLVMYKRRWG